MSDDTEPNAIVTTNPWTALKAYTPARIALGRAGSSLPTAAGLEFQLAHARARDAVQSELDVERLERDLSAHDTLHLQSAAPDRATYIMRPDLGRRLAEASVQTLAEVSQGYDAVFIVADGLSATAAQRHAAALLEETCAYLDGWRLAPVVIVEGGRVAIGDEIGEALQARFSVVFIGERPGLSAPDSLGVYITYAPRKGRTDAERNCISNVRPAGLSYEAAARELASLLRRAQLHGCTGVALGGFETKTLEDEG